MRIKADRLSAALYASRSARRDLLECECRIRARAHRDRVWARKREVSAVGRHLPGWGVAGWIPMKLGLCLPGIQLRRSSRSFNDMEIARAGSECQPDCSCGFWISN